MVSAKPAAKRDETPQGGRTSARPFLESASSLISYGGAQTYGAHQPRRRESGSASFDAGLSALAQDEGHYYWRQKEEPSS